MESYDVPLIETVVDRVEPSVLGEAIRGEIVDRHAARLLMAICDQAPTWTERVGDVPEAQVVSVSDAARVAARYVVARSLPSSPVVSAARAQDEPVRAVCSGGGPSRTPGMVLIEFMVPEGTPRRLSSEWLLSPIAEAVRDA